jgi:ATP-dependent helicase HrpB
MSEKKPQPAPKSLPIEAIKTEFISTLEQHNMLILCAPPGAGKSTYLPLWLLDLACLAGQKIIMLQPRRLATKTIATYLAKQLGEPVGQTIGYRMRNDSKVSANTRLEIVTEGILTKMIQQDGELADIGLVIFDEFHERSLHADLAFALSRDIQLGLRDDLKLMLMSATLDTDYLSQMLPDAKLLASEGRSYPVEISYAPPRNIRDWRSHALDQVMTFCQQHQGSVLVFLPGVADIKYLAEQLADKLPASKQVNPLYGELDIKQQQQAIAPSPEGIDKIVLSTNIAETSLTIDGINAVIDCGLEKVAIFNQDSLFNQLNQQQTSKASAVQRCGRAGRLMPGKCLRLFGKDEFERRAEQSVSEIQQSDLLPLLIEIAHWGVAEPNELPFVEQPDKQKVQRSWQELINLEIVNDNHKLTSHGLCVAKLPCHPRFSHMLLKAREIEQNEHIDGLGYLACLLAAMLEERDIYSKDQAQHQSEVAHRVIDIHRSQQQSKNLPPLFKRIINQANALAKLIEVKNTGSVPTDFTGVLIGFCYPERIALKKAQSKQSASSATSHYQLANGKGAKLESLDTLLKEPMLAIAHLHNRYQGGQKQVFISLASAIKKEHFERYFASQITTNEVLEYDNSTDKILHQERRCFNALILTSKPVKTSANQELITRMWVAQIQKQGLSVLNFSKQCLALLNRWRWLSDESPELGLPDVSKEHLLTCLDSWLAPYLGNIKSLDQLKKLELYDIVLNMLDYPQQQALNQLAPQYFTAPTGNRYIIEYTPSQIPQVSLPMQAVYGLAETPFINQGKTALTLALLSPAKRPLQVTRQLAEFWRGSYLEVQKEMKGRYPKHFWPDDPARAKPTTKTKKYM